jgi:hypothetical protein
MENSNGQPYTWCEPDRDDEDESTIPRRVYDGWVRVTRWDGSMTVVKVETVRFFGWVKGEIVYPTRTKGYPLYDDLFARGRVECIPEAEALAWLTQHKLPLPVPSDEETTRREFAEMEASEDTEHVG